LIFKFKKAGFTYSLIIFLSLLISACGGGGSSSGAPSGINSQTSTSTSTSQMASSSSLAALTTKITRTNTPTLMAGYLDLLDFAKETSVSIVNGDYDFSLADGNYEDVCDNNNSKLKLVVANGGNQLTQQYTNCQISVTDNTGTHKITLSGEEKITVNRRENSPSTFNLEWKKYSLSVNDEGTLILNGQFSYEGLLHFERTFTYENIHSKIKIDASVSDGTESMVMRNVALTVDFPSLFDPIENVYFVPRGMHVFHKKVLNASGELQIEKDAAQFLLDTTTSRVTFSGPSEAKAYMDNTQYGFFLRWDETGDNHPEANIFLTENEYPVVIDNLHSSNSPIYFTRYPNVYNTPYPPNHWSSGFYKTIDLSKGATTEINVQELFTSISGALLTYEIDNQSHSKDWEQIEAGKFLLKFPDAEGYEIFELKITAVDMYGNRSPVITAKVRMNDNLADFDKDGIPDYQDPDIDNDGIPNHEDRFDKDPTEYSDLDGDDIGDNADNDRDNDGVDNSGDAYPNDAACSKLESGDSESCYLTNSRYNFTDKNGIAYFIQEVKASTPDGKSRFIRFDTNKKQFLSPTATFDWAADYTYSYAYNPENHSVIVSNRTHDGYTVWQKVFILQLDDLSIIPIDNSRNYDMYAAFHDYGYFVFTVTESTWSGILGWIEVYDENGKLINTSESDARSTPKDDTYFSLQNSRGIDFCDFSVSVNNVGDIVKNGQYENRYDDNCDPTMQISENGMYGFTSYNYQFSLFNIDKQRLGEKIGYSPAWLGNTLVYTDGATNNLIATSFPSQQSKLLSAEQKAGHEIHISGNNILLTKITGYQSSASLQLYNADLQLLYDSADF
jgi:hypothetical protein